MNCNECYETVADAERLCALNKVYRRSGIDLEETVCPCEGRIKEKQLEP